MKTKKKTLEDKVDGAEKVLRYTFFIVAGIASVAFLVVLTGVYLGFIK